MDSNAYLFFSYSLIFWLLSYLIIRKSKSPANLLFSTATFLYGVGTLFSGIGWGFFSTTSNISYLVLNYKIIIDQLTFFAIAASFIVVAPLGIFFSGRVILHGSVGYKDEVAKILIALFFVIAVFNFFIYSSLPLRENFMFEDTLTAFVILLSLLVYFSLYRQIREYRINFIFILLGFSIGIIALVIGLALFLLNQNSTAEIIRSFGPFTAVFVVLISFTNLPQSFRNRNANNNN